MTRRIIVTGSRTWDNPNKLGYELGKAVGELNRKYPGEDIVIVHGNAPGADRIADKLARDHGVTVETHRAEWELQGKRAGMIRNMKMVSLGADICLAFIKDGSRGATHCAEYAESVGIPVRRFTEVSNLGQ
jgi:hypothetical protein